MRIVVNDIAASKGGAMTVLKDFYSCIKENDKENEWIFLLGDNYLEETENIKVITLPEIKKSGLKKLKFDFFTGKKFIKKLNPDVVFSMQNVITFGLKVPQVIYMHQSIPVQSVKRFSFFKGSERKLAFIQYIIGSIIKKSVKNAELTIVQTKWMKEAVLKKCKISEDRIVNILPTVKDVAALVKREDFDKKRFFYPTAPALYKNNAAVFAADKILCEEGVEHEIVLTLPEEKSCGSVKCVGRLPYEQVLTEYTKSTLVFPSYIETVGLPMAEAREVGGLVIASDCPFSREVLEGYENAYFFRYDDHKALALLMKQVIDGEITVKEAWAEKSQQENSWKEVMEKVISVGTK